jgi:hypothetical protein
MLRSTLLIIAGIIVGQEYRSLPNVKNELYKYYDSFSKTDFYKQLVDDLKKFK